MTSMEPRFQLFVITLALIAPAFGTQRFSPKKGGDVGGILNFAPAASYGSGGENAFSVATADVNVDGKLDLVVANECADANCYNGSVSILLGNGDGTFKSPVSYNSGGSDAQSVAVGDMNGDGKPDLLVVNQNGGGEVSVLLGNGDGTFQPAVDYSSGGYYAYSVAVADVNGDGKPDVLVANQCSGGNTCANGTVGVLLGNGDGTLQAAVSYGSGGYTANSVAVGDVNGDGDPDLLVVNQCGNRDNCVNSIVGVLLGNGDGTFQQAVSYGSGGYYAYSVAVGDVNGDGKPDLMMANSCASSNCVNGSVGVLLGNGDGTFKAAVSYGSGGDGTYSVAVGDVNGDGKPDLLVANDCADGNCVNGSVGVLLGNGDGTFQAAVTYGSGGYNTLSVAVGDVNGDSKPDLLVANQCASSNTCVNGFGNGFVGVLINIGIYTSSTSLMSSINPSTFGQSVTFSATVTSQGSGTPTGTVNFLDGTTGLGTSTLNGSGVATLSTSTLAFGTHSITAAYSGDSNFAPSTSTVLNQVVQEAIVGLNPTSLNFGNQTVHTASSPQLITLSNAGNINLNLTSLQVTGVDSSDFSETNNCPASIPPNGSCTISVIFNPPTTGTRTANVSITDNALNSPQSLPLMGVGVLPTATLSPTSLTFPIQVVFTTSPAQKVTLTNTGLGILKISGGAFTGQFGETNNCGSMLAPGASCTAEVSFKPKTKGTLNGTISLTDNAPGSPQKVTLTGIGTYLQITPAKINFGNQPIHTTSLAKTITISNKGTAQVTFTGISITGANGGDFAETNNCPASLSPGASCFAKVKFTPSQQGTRTATVQISDDGGGSPQAVPLRGTGTP